MYVSKNACWDHAHIHFRSKHSSIPQTAEHKAAMAADRVGKRRFLPYASMRVGMELASGHAKNN
eukprot:13346576-Alexandrium_andersonii.AAC.1